MAAGKYDFTIEQGATFDIELQYTDSNGDPIDLTGYTSRMQVKNKVGGSTIYMTLTSDIADDGTGLNMSGSAGVNSPTMGTIGLHISAYSSSMLNFSRASYDLELVSDDEYPVVIRLVGGVISLSKEVTTI